MTTTLYRLDEPAVLTPNWNGIDNWYHDVFAALKDRDIKCAPNSRLFIQQKALKEFISNPKTNAHLSRMVQSSLSDIFQLRTSIQYIDQISLNPLLSHKLKAVLKDAAELPEAVRKNTAGRDTQFELFTISCIKRSYKAIFSSAPGADIIIEKNGCKQVLEVKRIKKDSRIQPILEKAGSQIKRTNVKGVIAIELSEKFPQIFANTHNEALQKLGSCLQSFSSIFDPLLRRLSKNCGVVGVSAFVNSFAMVDKLLFPINFWSHWFDQDHSNWRFTEAIFESPKSLYKF